MCYDVLYLVMVCYLMLCDNMLCHIMSCYVLIFYVIYFMSSSAMSPLPLYLPIYSPSSFSFLLLLLLLLFLSIVLLLLLLLYSSPPSQLELCPRTTLDVDTVLYLHTPEERLNYAVTIESSGLFRSALSGTS